MIQIPYTNQPTKSFLLVAQVEMYKHQVLYVGEKRGDGARKRPCVFDDVSTVLFAGFAKNTCILQFILVEM